MCKVDGGKYVFVIKFVLNDKGVVWINILVVEGLKLLVEYFLVLVFLGYVYVQFCERVVNVDVEFVLYVQAEYGKVFFVVF